MLLTRLTALRYIYQMGSRIENLYAVWRAKYFDTAFLRDENPTPPEKLLQAVWQHQRLLRDQLKTDDGKSVRVLHPGFISLAGGPDFRDAVLQIGNEPPISGDVEIDLQASGWHAHGHDINPAFKKVILRAVWHDSRTPVSRAAEPPPIPILILQNRLDAPLAELARTLENESGLPEKWRGKCSAPLGELNVEQLAELLHAAAKVRFQNKAAAMLARAKNSGWEAALWENLFRALGYKNNVWPMQHLAEQRARLTARALHPDESSLPPADRTLPSLLTLQARLMGVGGLLPAELTRTQKSSDTFLRHAWDVWWRERDAFADCTLPRATWQFHGLRPANHPQRRLALASHWIMDTQLISKIENWLVLGISHSPTVLARRVAERQAGPAALVNSLHDIFQVAHDDYWSWHWTFKSVRMTRPKPLLGEARVTDLAMNVVLPWLWIRAKEGGNEMFQREVEQRYFTWPTAEDNSVLKLARLRLLGHRSTRGFKNAAAQQGLMQVVRDFCEHSNAICTDCRFPELVRAFAAGGKDKEAAGNI